MSSDRTTALSAGERSPGRRVLVVMHDEGVATHPLPERGEIVVGRGATATIRVDHPSVSRAHVALELDRGVRVRDLGSANGTTLRGARLRDGVAVAIAVNETVLVGDVALIVQERRGVRAVVGGGEDGAAAAAGATGAAGTGAAARGAPVTPVVLDPAMLNLTELARRVAGGTLNVLVTGESGVGKEVLAELLHGGSVRAGGPLVKVNCAAIADTLVESELFGHERGAFTGAATAKQGLIEAADGGTLFLDEVGELSAAAQAKLLRVVEDRRVQRVGATAAREVDVRIVAATHRDLEAEAAAGRFRRDLYYRLAGIVLDVPPLRERRGEIEPLAHAFAASAARGLGRAAPTFAPGAVAALLAHDWPGNVRELRNTVERAVLLTAGAIAAADLFPVTRARPAPAVPAMAATAAVPAAGGDERARIVAALDACAGNQTRAAAMLGMPLRTLVKRLAQYQIPRPKKR